MTLKTIKIDEFTYEKLLERKKDEENISDVIKRLLKIEKDLPLEEKNLILEQKLLQTRKKIENHDVFHLQTWLRVVDFIKSVLNRCWQEQIDITNPEVFIDPSDGSHDIHWLTESFELLLIIPRDINELVHISGERNDAPEFEIEARINFEFITEWILDWLRKIL